MGKLEELKELVSQMFESAEDKTLIDNLSKAQTLVEGAIKEDDQDKKEKAQLLKDYKEAIKYNAGDNNIVVENGAGIEPDFDALLQQALNTK